MSHLTADKTEPQPKLKKLKTAARVRINRTLGDYELQRQAPKAAHKNRSVLYLTIGFALLIACFAGVWSANRFGGSPAVAQNADDRATDAATRQFDLPKAASLDEPGAEPAATLKSGRNTVKPATSAGARKSAGAVASDSAEIIQKRIAATVQPAHKPDGAAASPAKPLPTEPAAAPRKKSVTIAQPYYQP